MVWLLLVGGKVFIGDMEKDCCVCLVFEFVQMEIGVVLLDEVMYVWLFMYLVGIMLIVGSGKCEWIFVVVNVLVYKFDYDQWFCIFIVVQGYDIF